ncbi:MAG: hypothetical protein SGILL_006954 [Bacillariaceae sp.]
MDITLDLPSLDHVPFPIINMDIPVNQVFDDEEEAAFGSWKQAMEEENCDVEMMEADILMVDKELGSRLLDADLFGGAPCESPIGPIEELLHVVEFSKEDQKVLLSPFFDDDEGSQVSTESLPFEERYKATLKKLALTMKRSQETRKSLTMKTSEMKKYERIATVKNILQTVKDSADKVQTTIFAEQA